MVVVYTVCVLLCKNEFLQIIHSVLEVNGVASDTLPYSQWHKIHVCRWLGAAAEMRFLSILPASTNRMPATGWNKNVCLNRWQHSTVCIPVRYKTRSGIPRSYGGSFEWKSYWIGANAAQVLQHIKIDIPWVSTRDQHIFYGKINFNFL